MEREKCQNEVLKGAGVGMKEKSGYKQRGGKVRYPQGRLRVRVRARLRLRCSKFAGRVPAG